MGPLSDHCQGKTQEDLPITYVQKEADSIATAQKTFYENIPGVTVPQYYYVFISSSTGGREHKLEVLHSAP